MSAYFPTRILAALVAAFPLQALADCPIVTPREGGLLVSVEVEEFKATLDLNDPYSDGVTKSTLTMLLPSGESATAGTLVSKGEFVVAEASPPYPATAVTVCSSEEASCVVDVPPVPTVEFRQYVLSDGTDRFIVRVHRDVETLGVLVGARGDEHSTECLPIDTNYQEWLAAFEEQIAVPSLFEVPVSFSEAQCPADEKFASEPTDVPSSSSLSETEAISSIEDISYIQLAAEECQLPYIYSPNLVRFDIASGNPAADSSKALNRLQSLVNRLAFSTQSDMTSSLLRRTNRTLRRLLSVSTPTKGRARLVRLRRNITKLRLGGLSASEQEILLQQSRDLVRRVKF